MPLELVHSDLCGKMGQKSLGGKTCGIRHELTIPKTPEQNGAAERLNRTLVEKTRTMLLDAKLPQSYWAEAIATANYLRNRSPTSAIDGMPHGMDRNQTKSVSSLAPGGRTETESKLTSLETESVSQSAMSPPRLTKQLAAQRRSIGQRL